MNKEKMLSYGTGALLAIIGLGAVGCGMMLMLQPDGESIGLSLDLLENTPFENFLIPGIVLFAINGVASLVGAFLSFKNHRYAGFATMILGVAMIIWITAEVYWIGGESFLQPTMFTVGLAELILGFYQQTQHPDYHGFFKHQHHTHAH